MSSDKIIIIDYKMGNLSSVYNAFRFLNFDIEISQDKNKIRNSRGLILPGVGAFGDAMKNIEALGIRDTICQEIKKGKPYLGICLGYQLLFEESEEDNNISGLSILKGKVIKFKTSKLKVPHIGWNQVKVVRNTPVLKDTVDDTYFYFVHSYYPLPEDKEIIVAETEYDEVFASAVAQNNIFASQFHPEKSQTAGMQIIKNFGEFCVDHSRY